MSAVLLPLPLRAADLSSAPPPLFYHPKELEKQGPPPSKTLMSGNVKPYEA